MGNLPALPGLVFCQPPFGMLPNIDSTVAVHAKEFTAYATDPLPDSDLPMSSEDGGQKPLMWRRWKREATAHALVPRGPITVTNLLVPRVLVVVIIHVRPQLVDRFRIVVSLIAQREFAFI